MAEPLRELALRAIVNILETELSTVRPWGGQYPAKPKVSRIYKDSVDTSEWPYLIVSQASNSRLGRVYDQGTSSSSDYKHEFRFVVYGYVHGNDVVLPGTWAERLQDDVIKIIYANQLLGGVSQGGIIADNDETDEGQSYPMAFFAQYFIATLNEAIYAE